MKIEKICEYFISIGILRLENINSFLKIYSQLSINQYKNKKDKLILALFSYITLLTKSEQLLFETSRNIVNNLSNAMTLKRYHSLQTFNNIIKAKLHSKFISFVFKLSLYISSKKRKNRSKYLHTFTKLNNANINSEKETEIVNDFDSYNESNYATGISKDKNKLYIMSKIKNNFFEKPSIRRYKIISDISNYDMEETITPNITFNNQKNNKINKSNILNNLNKNIRIYSPFNKSMSNINNLSYNKIIPFKNSVNYGKNNKINNEIEKLMKNISKYNNIGNNAKYLPRKNLHTKQMKNLNQIQTNSYDEFPISSYNNTDNNYNNLKRNSYYNKGKRYNFLQNEKNHMKKVQNKIMKMKAQKMNQISKECTFYPEINQNSKYINLNKSINNDINNNENKILTEFNNISQSQRNYNYINNPSCAKLYTSFNNLNNTNNNNYYNITINSRKTLPPKKNIKINKEYEDDYYNIYSRKLNNEFNLDNRQRPLSHSHSKNYADFLNYNYEDGDNKIYSIYKTRKEELSKLFNEKHPFIPSINYNKNIQIKSTFDERQEQFIKNKQRLNKLKEEEELKQIKEFNKINRNRSKANSKEVVKRLYDKEATKIKDRLKKEKEEKLNKKNVIDWERREKEYKEKYPNDFKIKTIKRKKKLNNNTSDDIQHYQNEKYKFNNSKRDNFKDFDNLNKNNIDEKKNEDNNQIFLNANDIDQNNKLLIDKIKDEHIIGFKYNNISNIINYNNMSNNNSDNWKRNISGNKYIKKKINRNIKESIKDNLKDSINESYKDSININSKNKGNIEGEELFNIDERAKYFKNENLLDNINKEGIKSSAFQEIINNTNYNK